MRQIHVQYASGSELIEDYLRDLDFGGLFVRTTDEFSVGERVELTIVFPDVPDGVALRGDVIWRRAPMRWRSALLPGIGVGFVEEHHNRAEFLLDFCNGELSALRVKGRRVPADFRVDILSESKKIQARAKDISKGGLFVRTETPFAKDSKLDLLLHLSQSEPPARVPARVAWSRAVSPDVGIGVEFLFRTPIRRAQITRYVRDLEARLSIPPPPARDD